MIQVEDKTLVEVWNIPRITVKQTVEEKKRDVVHFFVCSSQTSGGRLGTAEAVWDPAAAEQSEELSGGENPHHLQRAAEDAGCAQECAADGGGGELHPQA